MTPTLSSWISIISLNTIMQYKDFKGGLKGCYKKKNPPLATCAVTIEFSRSFFSTNRSMMNLCVQSGRNTSSLGRNSTTSNSLDTREEPTHTQQTY